MYRRDLWVYIKKNINVVIDMIYKFLNSYELKHKILDNQYNKLISKIKYLNN